MVTKKIVKKSLSQKIPRESGVSSFVYDLIDAEEQYLRSHGWRLIKRSGTHSVWRNPEFVIDYSRNHAIIVAKSSDPNIANW